MCVLPGDLDREALAKADCFTLRPHSWIDSRFLAMQLASARSYRYLSGDIHGATRPRINTTQLRGLPIPLCSLDEQLEIVRRFEDLSGVTAALVRRVVRARQRLDRSSQAILAKAFRGQLSSAPAI
ncbi:MAG: restriction endonuclease subunit S [Acidimicrobiia bacterium]